MQKGQEIMIEGKIVNKMYEKEGEKRYTTNIEITDFLLLSPKNNEKEEELVESQKVQKTK